IDAKTSEFASGFLGLSSLSLSGLHQQSFFIEMLLLPSLLIHKHVLRSRERIKCSGSGDWEGEFFHEIPHIKDLRAVTHLLTNAEEEILGSNPLAYKWIHLSEDDRSTFDRPNLLLPKEPVDSRKLQEETCRWNIVPSVHHSMYILPY
ncbi:hypothetical protein HID58_051383, partial [Brassica napus]